MLHILAALAALMGAAGVATAALAAHAAASPLLPSAAQMLMVHAAAVLALLALGHGRREERWFAAVAGAMIVGVCLFAGDLSARVWLDGRLFPFAAPIGGGLTIAAWLAAAGVSILAIFRG
ncbi:MAG TPA: DUF423 domain-containing protein [Rhodoblastus sp.]|nr:DUF423 domain-containing protein [Rhodoblastus sp.]